MLDEEAAKGASAGAMSVRVRETCEGMREADECSVSSLQYIYVHQPLFRLLPRDGHSRRIEALAW